MTQDLIEYYINEAKRLTDFEKLSSIRMRGYDDLQQLGFPKRRDEEWKYTDVAGFLKQTFKSNSDSVCKVETESLPDGVVVKPLIEALKEHENLVLLHLNQIMQQEHGFLALNSAAMEHGTFIFVPADVTINLPVELLYHQNKAGSASYIRNLIVLEPRANLQVIERYEGESDSCYCTNTVTEIYLAKQSKLAHYKLLCEGNKSLHFGHIAIQQREDSQFSQHTLSLGGDLVRSDLMQHFLEPGGHALLNGIYMPDALQHIDHHTTVCHDVPNCTSVQDYKGILSGRAVFNGKVKVAPNAQHTAAEQQNKNILLHNKAEIDTKPQLEIFADDVVCSHGATVGQLDKDALFYFATRGIDKEYATQLLIRAFIASNITRMENQIVARESMQLIEQQLENML